MTSSTHPRLAIIAVIVVALLAALGGKTSAAPASATADDETRQDSSCAKRPPGLTRARQIAKMLCLVNRTRRRHGLRPLTVIAPLSRGAAGKASDIARCHAFSHTACGKRADQDTLQAGYQGPFGEILYLGDDSLATPQAALQGWLQSPPHRKNLLQPAWRTIGIALRRHTRARTEPHTTIRGTTWVIQFGT